MHIPDGYLSPGTCAVFYASMAPVWYVGFKKAGEALGARRMPLLSLSAAFGFVIMMFNFPLPGGTSAHVTGGALSAILLGPWGAVSAMTLTLALQALVFGDGGITAFGANAFNMGLLPGLVGYYTYRAATLNGPCGRRRSVAFFLAGYAAVLASSMAAAIELGIQPAIAGGADGALYAPYPLSITVPAMMIPALSVLGPVEGVVTALVMRGLEGHLRGAQGAVPPAGLKSFAAVLLALCLLTPLGLIYSGTVWGEWGKAQVLSLLGHVPPGLARLNGLWEGLLPGYTYGGGPLSAAIYVGSALAGSALLVLAVFLWGRLWKR